jgi:rifampicin phosphotransferase
MLRTTDFRDPLESATDDHSYWSTTNAGEEMPGVPTPLGWSVSDTAAELVTSASFHAMGALAKSDIGPRMSRSLVSL